MSNLFGNIDDFLTDSNMETEGVDLAFGKDRFITVRRAGGANVAFTNYLANEFKDNEFAVSRETMSDEEAREIMYNAYASFVVIGWRGWCDAKAKELPYSKENCIALFTESREIYEHVVRKTNDLNSFRIKEVKDSGNE